MTKTEEIKTITSPATGQHPMLAMIADVMMGIAAGEWPILAPWADALLWAQERGDSYIVIPYEHCVHLSEAVKLVGSPYGFAPFILDQNRLFLGRLWQLEQDIAASLCQLAMADAHSSVASGASEDLQRWFSDPQSRQQQFAAALALYQPFMLINGGPGTGKTTTVAKILALLLKYVWSSLYPPRIALVAPTGKAAAHMAQALHRALSQFAVDEKTASVLMALEGQTVHRLLRLKPPLMECAYDQANPLPVDMLVVDESSMLDLSLFRLLVRALKPGTRLILLGDANQLAAVGAGNVLGDLSKPTCLTPALARQLTALLGHGLSLPVSPTAHMSAHVATLVHSYRFQADQGIGALALACIQSDSEAAQQAMGDFPEQLQWGHTQPSLLYQTLYPLQETWWQAVRQKDIAAVFTHLADVMILAVRRNDAQAFNEGYRHFLQQKGHAGLDNWFAGMPLLITQNDYHVGVFNGDVGVVLPDEQEPERLVAYFKTGSHYRSVPLSRLPEHETAFAITVHKSQGSEYESVWLLAPQTAMMASEPLFNQALLYTALTRARRQFVFCGLPLQLTQAIRQKQVRRSGLGMAVDRLYARIIKNHS
ncbi:exodeoxyribonuclease V subunit alpha [Neisseriaceae bacterium ESL0693]|nr:exodeoxyribonuclease V subunit alpha [Neisseriaceae bacterium ESL0693]